MTDPTGTQSLMESRDSGMIEMGTAVIHNISNALTPAKVAASTTLSLLEGSPFRLYLINALSSLPDIVRQTTLISDAEKDRLEQILELLPENLHEEYDKMIEQVRYINQALLHIEDVIQLQRRTIKTNTARSLNFNALVTDSIRLLKQSLSKHHVIVSTNLTPFADTYGEENKLLQVLTTIVRNSIDAMQKTPLEQRFLKLSTTVEASGEQLIFHAIDNGIGFNPAQQSELFNFGYTTKGKYSGFGLHACAQYLNAHDGSIEAQSQGIGQGATFIIRLPLGKSQ